MAPTVPTKDEAQDIFDELTPTPKQKPKKKKENESISLKDFQRLEDKDKFDLLFGKVFG